MADQPVDKKNAYQKDGVEYLGKIIELFGGYKKRSLEFLNLAPGLRILDVGCGSGEDAMAIAGALGGQVEVVGVDASEQMLAAANQHKEASPLPVSFQKGDACSLPFEDNAFDRSRADRVFQHIDTMEQALNEMIRVTKPDGWISVLDVDWGSVSVDSTEDSAGQKILACGKQIVPNPSAGTKLYGMFKRSGLQGVEAYAETVCVLDWPIAKMIWGLDVLAAKAAEAGVVSQEEADAWISDLESKHERGEFFSSITGFVVRGQKAT